MAGVAPIASGAGGASLGGAAGSPAEQFAVLVAQQTGLNLNVVRGWVHAEGGGPGTDNFLNLRGYGKSWSGAPVAGAGAGGFTSFPSVQAAASETSWWINHMSNYAGIRAAAKRNDPRAQLSAIASSPWDAGHYGGNGKNLLASYNAVAGRKGALSGIVSAVEHPVRSAQQAAGGLASTIGDALLKAALFLVLLALGAGLIYEGLRRLSGGALPHPQSLVRLPGGAGLAGAVAA